jgi:hypothetical protein
MAFQITEVQKALKGVDYPASKEELASHAERNGGDRELVDALRSMNKDSFDGPNARHEGAERLPHRLGGLITTGRRGASAGRASKMLALRSVEPADPALIGAGPPYNPVGGAAS